MQRLLLCTLLLSVAAFSNARTTADPELEAIRAVAQAYISGDPAKLRDAFLPTMNLHTTDDKEALRIIPFSEYIQRVAASTNSVAEERQAHIEYIDRTGNVAVVKVTTSRPKVKVTDYLSLVRVEKQWKIVNKVFFSRPVFLPIPRRSP